MRGCSYIWIYIAVFFISGCGKPEIETKADLLGYIESHRDDFRKHRKFKELDVDVRCIPNELRKERGFDGGLSFVFSISSGEQDFLKRYSHNYEEYRQYKWYLMNSWKDFIYIEQEGRKVPPDIAQFEERYELGKGCVYNIVFDRTQLKGEELTLVYDDQIFGMGKLKFQFDLSVLRDIPINEKTYYNTL